MAHLNDYLTKNLDKPLSEMPFNEVDYSLLSQLSYLELDGIVSEGPLKTSFAAAYAAYKAQNRESKSKATDELFMKVANSARYKNLKLSHFKQVNDPKTLEQFGAYALDISKMHKAVFFRPTNGTLYAWKENFTVAYQPTSKTQEESATYFNKLAMMHPLQTFTLCGHSKGGNNAMYAASQANIFNQTKITQVLNFDGSGFNFELNKGITNPSLLEKVTTYIPQGSVVGRLLDHNERVVIVKGDDPQGVGQHDMNEWQVGNEGFIRGERTNYKSNIIDKKFREILNKYSIEQRKLLVDGLFEILENTGCTELDDIIKEPKKLIHAYFKSEKKPRKFVRDVALSVLRDKKFMKAMFGKKKKDIEKYFNNTAVRDKFRNADQETNTNTNASQNNEEMLMAC